MMHLFDMGGPLFMGLLTLVLITMLSVSLIQGTRLIKGPVESLDEKIRRIGYIKSIGLFACVLGILGQLIGLFSAFQAIELQQVEVSRTVLASGFKVSMITTIYGLSIYGLSLIIWLVFSLWVRKDR